MNRRPETLVTGAAGALGPIVVRRLIDRGYRVRALTRRQPPPGLFPPEVEVFLGDVTDRDSLEACLAGVDSVFHLAARLSNGGSSPKREAEIYRVNVGGTRCLLEEAVEAGARRFIHFGSISVYGSTCRGEPAEEGTALNPQDHYARSKAEADALALDGASGGGRKIETVVLRLAAVYGSRMKGNYIRLARALRRGFFLQVGDGGNRRTLVHEEDAAAAAILAAEHPGAAGMVFNVTDGGTHSLRAIIEAICHALDRPPPRFYLPAAPLRAAARLLDAVRLLAGRGRLPGFNPFEKLLEDVAVSGGRIQRELGFRPAFDLASGWRESMKSLREFL